MNCDLYHCTCPFHQWNLPSVIVQGLEVIIVHDGHEYLLTLVPSKNAMTFVPTEAINAAGFLMPTTFLSEIQLHISAHKKTA